MDTLPLPILIVLLLALIFLSAFFSSAETGMMALNRYRLRHLVDDGKKRGAKLANQLLKRPDRLLGVVLVGNNIVNIFASAIATVLAVQLVGSTGYALGPALLIPIILIFAETAPKTYAAIRPEKIAFPAAYILTPLLKLLLPVVSLVNKISNALLIPLGVTTIDKSEQPQLSQDELRSIVHEAGTAISSNHQNMLLGILDMEQVTVEDIMLPRGEIAGIDLDNPMNDIIDQLIHCQHTRLVIYRGGIDNVVGMLHTRRILRVLGKKIDLTPDELEKQISEPYFLMQGVSLYTQMLRFQKDKQRAGLVIDEYGVVQGMVTLDDILEEIIGEFTTDVQTFSQDIQPQEDGAYLIDGRMTLRDLNKQLNWSLPTDGPKTVNGFILEHLEQIPEMGTSFRIDEYIFQITQIADNAVKKVKVFSSPELGENTTPQD